MDDAIQEEGKKLSFYNNKKLGDHDIDIKMKILHQEENIFLLNMNNNNENNSQKQYNNEYWQSELSYWGRTQCYTTKRQGLFSVIMIIIMVYLKIKTKREIKM